VGRHRAPAHPVRPHLAPGHRPLQQVGALSHCA
jgi:hypothetical protein